MSSTYQLTAADVQTFRIVDATDLFQSGAGNDQTNLAHRIRAYKDGSSYYETALTSYGFAYAYTITAGGSPTFVNVNPVKAYDTSVRVWLYLKAGLLALWFDDDASQSLSVAPVYSDPVTVASAPGAMAQTICGNTQAGITRIIKMGTDVFGSMTVS